MIILRGRIVGAYRLLLVVHGGNSLSKSLSRALDLINSLGGALDLGAALAGVSAPLLKSGGVCLSHGFGEGISGALDLGGDIGSALHHVAALAGVGTPSLSNGLRLGLSRALSASLAGVTAPLLHGTTRSGRDGGGCHEGKDDGEEPHGGEGKKSEIDEGLGWKLLVLLV